MNNFSRPSGFTLFEILLIVVLVGVLILSAVPSFIQVSLESRLAERDSVVSAVRSGIDLYRAKTSATHGGPGKFPEQLDRAPAKLCANEDNPFFIHVLEKGVQDTNWFKGEGINIYYFYDGSRQYLYTYHPETGDFAEGPRN